MGIRLPSSTSWGRVAPFGGDTTSFHLCPRLNRSIMAFWVLKPKPSPAQCCDEQIGLVIGSDSLWWPTLCNMMWDMHIYAFHQSEGLGILKEQPIGIWRVQPRSTLSSEGGLSWSIVGTAINDTHALLLVSIGKVVVFGVLDLTFSHSMS